MVLASPLISETVSAKQLLGNWNAISRTEKNDALGDLQQKCQLPLFRSASDWKHRIMIMLRTLNRRVQQSQ